MISTNLYDTSGNLYWYRHQGQQDGTSRWLGKNAVNLTGWEGYISVFASGNILYAIHPDGNLYWYRHDGQQDGTNQWTDRKLVGESGWDQFISVCVTGNILYAVHPDGNLYWYRHEGQQDGTKQWAERQLVGEGGWDQFISVCVSSNIIYAVHPDGNLYWYRHDGQQDGTKQWAERQVVGEGGWEQYISICVSGNIIYAVHPDGNLYWYRHEGQQDGTKQWAERQVVSEGGWLIYKSVFTAGAEILYGVGTDTQSWMSGIPSSRKLNQFTIPGTHDTGTWPLSFTVWKFINNAKCQNLSLEEQLNAGIRFIDVRVTQSTRNGQPDFEIYHSHEETGLWFSTDIVDVCKKFLATHPSETIIMSVKDEFGSTDDFEPNLKLYLDPSFCLLGTNIPSLKEARKHIVLVRRYEFGSCGIAAHDHWPPDAKGEIKIRDANNAIVNILKIQDIYGFGFTDAYFDDLFISQDERGAKLDKKWKFIEEYLNYARTEQNPINWWINFASASGPPLIINPIDFAAGITGYTGMTERILHFIEQYPQGNFGAVMMDFPEHVADGLLIKRLIRTNLIG
jgi:hypothetical protein